MLGYMEKAFLSLQITVMLSGFHGLSESWLLIIQMLKSCVTLGWCPWWCLHLESKKRCLFQAVCGRVMRDWVAQNSIMWSVLCMCVFMICIDSCAWQIGYELGNILACKWNILDCRSTLGGVLNSQGHHDILFVGVKNLCYPLCVCLV